MYQLNVEADLNLPHRQNDESVNQLLSEKLALDVGERFEINELPFWEPSQFQLHRSTLFKSLSQDIQDAILKRCNDTLMADFYFLEKSGLAYCAKMMLLSETTQASQLYGLIAGDEATHLQWFSHYVGEELRTNPQGKLLPVLGKIIEDCDANSLYYLVQTLIEGWGVITYKTLASTCTSKHFRQLLQQILRDEALHHQSGAALFCPQKINHLTSIYIFDKMKAYAEVFRVGPQTVVECIERETGELPLNALILLFEELKTQMLSGIKLQYLKNLMNQPSMETYVERLENAGYLKPYDPTQCARIFQRMRGLQQFF